VVVTEIDDERAMSANLIAVKFSEQLSPDINIHIRKDFDAAYDLWMQMVRENGMGLAGGSFYLYSPLVKKVKRPI
jgi:hypothetical protein